MADPPRLPSPRPWWWLAMPKSVTQPARETGAEFITCPWCSAPAETVPWHASSSLLDRMRETGGGVAQVGSAFFRATCVFGHWFLAPSGAGEVPEDVARTSEESGRR